MKVKAIKEVVFRLLHSKPTTKDSDANLVARIWWEVLKKEGLDPYKTSAATFLTILADESLLPSFESIRRARQKLQKHHPELRGERYQDRQKLLEPKVRKEIRQWGQE